MDVNGGGGSKDARTVSSDNRFFDKVGTIAGTAARHSSCNYARR